MNQSEREKPSLIIMLAPMALVFIGYYYLFLMSLNKELTASGKRQSDLQEQTQNIELEQATLDSRITVVKKDLAKAQNTARAAENERAGAESAKLDLRAAILGQSPANQGPTSGENLSVAGTHPDGSTSSTSRSVKVSTVSKANDSPTDSDDGQSSSMSKLCSILDQHGLQRLAISAGPKANRNSLVEAERATLEKLLDTELPAVSRYEIRLVGSFPKLVAAMHGISDKLPTVSILSIALEPVDVRTRRHVWKLEIGIRG